MPARMLFMGAVAASGLVALTIATAPVEASGAAKQPAKSTPQVKVHRKDGGYISIIRQGNGDATEVFSTAGPVSAAGFGPVSSRLIKRRGVGTNTAHDTSDAVTEYDDTGSLAVSAGGKSFSTATDQDVSTVAALEDLGVSSSDAAPYASMDASPVNTTNTDTADPNAVRRTDAATRASSSPVNNNQLRDLICINHWSDGTASQHRVHLYGCERQYLVWKSKTTSGLWGLEDKFLATGISHDSAIFDPDEISGVEFGTYYGSGNTIDDYSPSVTYNPKGDCTDQTWSVSYEDYKISQEGPVCKASFGPEVFDQTHFYTKWDGQGNGVGPGVARSASGVDDVYDPPSADPDVNVYWKIWWVG